MKPFNVIQTDNFSIKLADVTHTAKLAELSILANPINKLSRSMFLRLLGQGVRGYTVWNEDVLIAACLIAIKKLKRKSNILHLAIHPEFVNAGLGNVLLTVVEQDCSRMNLTTIGIGIPKAAENDYVTLVKRGYITTSEYKNHMGEMLKLQKLLPQYEMYPEKSLRKMLRKINAI